MVFLKVRSKKHIMKSELYSGDKTRILSLEARRNDRHIFDTEEGLFSFNEKKSTAQRLDVKRADAQTFSSFLNAIARLFLTGLAFACLFGLVAHSESGGMFARASANTIASIYAHTLEAPILFMQNIHQGAFVFGGEIWSIAGIEESSLSAQVPSSGVIDKGNDGIFETFGDGARVTIEESAKTAKGATNMFSKIINTASDAMQSFFLAISEGIKIAFFGKADVPPAPEENGIPAKENSSQKGIIVVPSTGDEGADQEFLKNIKASFSDEVEVFPDPSGTSGVIRPVFRSGASEEEYMYVLVPIP